MMGEMIESVLSFARDDAKHEPRSLVDLSALVEGILRRRIRRGRTGDILGTSGRHDFLPPDSHAARHLQPDRQRLKYGGSAAVSLIPEAERVVITVEDEGPGIPRRAREGL